jgi:hypothetical protein
MAEIKEQDIELSFSSFEAPKEVVPVGSQFFAFVPYTMKVKSKDAGEPV